MQTQPNQLKLIAPLSGVPLSLEAVPDPVFSQKMMGDGWAIDPTGDTLVAPCSGEIVLLHKSLHALTIETPDGTQILIHLGIDTVNLKGEGFSAFIQQGEKVQAGQKLIQFDTDLLAKKALSLVSVIIIVEGSTKKKYKLTTPVQSQVKAGQQDYTCINFEQVKNVELDQKTSSRSFQSVPFFVRLPSGMHARPAAQLAELSKKFESQIEFIKQGKQASLSSLVSVLGLEIQKDDEITILATGNDCHQAVKAVLEYLVLLEEKEIASFKVEHRSTDDTNSTYTQLRSNERTILGIKASAGVVVGTVVELKEEEFEYESQSEHKELEINQFEEAMGSASSDLEKLSEKYEKEQDANKAAIFAAHKSLLEDPDLVAETVELINKGHTSAFAWNQVIQLHCDRLRSLKNELIAGRANDLKDIGNRVLRKILDKPEGHKFESVKDAILIAEDLTPSDMAMFENGSVRGFCTTLGGATSHVAIMARSMGIPALAGTEKRCLELENGRNVILDADRGALLLDPTESEINNVKKRQALEESKKSKALQECFRPAITTDGNQIEVVANISGITDAEKSIANGGEGVGLLRTEFLFLEREKAPTEEEQLEIYQSIADALGDKTLVIRTMDVGGDKSLKYLPIEPEENPFLGVRGIRLSLENKDIFRTQLRALLRVEAKRPINIMFPMIGQLSELRAAKQILSEEMKNTGRSNVKVGMMIEVPSAAVMAETFAKEVDFFSVGTNDLTQYTMAMDRGHNSLAKQIDGLHPAVLNMISMTVNGAHKYGKWVGVCGGIASDMQAIPILLGLGIDELSLSIPQIPMIKSNVRKLNKLECLKLTKEALALSSAEEVRELVSKKWPDLA